MSGKLQHVSRYERPAGPDDLPLPQQHRRRQERHRNADQVQDLIERMLVARHR